MLCGKMPIQAGTKLGQYEVVALIGEGVYPSRDCKGADHPC